MVRLRKQARHCNFGTSLNDNLRDQLIEKLTDFELKRKLLEQRNITLEELLDRARAWEAAGRQASNMRTSPPLADGNSINVVKELQQTTNDERRKCYNCGREAHLARDRNCLAKGKKCAKCRRYGHFALCCRGERDSDVVRGKASKQQRISGGRPRHVVNFVGNQEASGSDEDCAFAFMVTETKEKMCHTISCDEPVIEIGVDGISKKALIDSGSVSNLMGMSKYEELKPQGLDVKLENCHKRLYAYGGKVKFKRSCQLEPRR